MSEFDFGLGPVSAHQHPRGGGWVADTAEVDETCYVGPYATVFGFAEVRDNAFINDNAKVYGKALVQNNAKVYGNAEVYEDCVIMNNGRVSGNAKIYGQAVVADEASVFDDAEVYGNVVLKNFVEIYDNAKAHGNFQLSGFAKIYNKSVVTRPPVVIEGYQSTLYFTDHHVSIGCITLPVSVWKKYWEKIMRLWTIRKENVEPYVKLFDAFMMVAEVHGVTDRQEDLNSVEEDIKKIMKGDTQDRIFAIKDRKNRTYAKN